MIKILDIGLTPYETALQIQKQCISQIIENSHSGIIILCEHPAVYTFGKSADPANLLATPALLKQIGATVYQTDRGGDITFHGPGQLVVYPIINLAHYSLGIKDYVCCLEKSMIALLKDYGIEAGCIQGLTGVWLPANAVSDARKIGAIGIRVSHGITSHGIALNVNTDLSFFDHIVPCGIEGKSVTSMEKELGRNLDMASIKEGFVAAFKMYLKS